MSTFESLCVIGIILSIGYTTYVWQYLKKKISESATEIESYTLPTASADTLGGIKIGNGLQIADDGTVSVIEQTVTTEANDYELPIASADTLGGVKIGNGLKITEDGTISVIEQAVSGNADGYVLPVASSETLGGIKVGNGLFVADDGTASATGMDVLILESKPSVDDLEQGQVALIIEE